MFESNNGSKIVAKYSCLLKVQYFVQLHFSNIFCFCLPSKKRKSYNLHKDFNNVQYFRTPWNMHEGLVHPSFDSLFGVYAWMCRIHRRIWITNFIPIRTHGVYTQGKSLTSYWCFMNITYCVKSARSRNFSEPYLVRLRENVDQDNFEYRHFSHGAEYYCYHYYIFIWSWQIAKQVKYN